MKFNLISRQRITLLLSTVMVLTSVIPSGVPVYANELPDDNILLVEESADDNTGVIIQDNSDENSEEALISNESDSLTDSLFDPALLPDESDSFVDVDTETVASPAKAYETEADTAVAAEEKSHIYIETLAYSKIVYSEYDVSGNLIKKDKTAANWTVHSGFDLDVPKGGKAIITRVEFSDYNYFQMFDWQGNAYVFPGKMKSTTNSADVINPVYSGSDTTWTISNVTSDKTYTFGYTSYCLDNLVTCSAKQGDYPVEAVAYSGIEGHDLGYNPVTYLANTGAYANDYSSNKNGSFYVQLNPYEYDRNNTYSITEASYKDADGKTKQAKITYTLGYYQVEIDRSDVMDLLVKGGKKLELSVTQEAHPKTFQFTVDRIWGGVNDLSVEYNGTIVNENTPIEVKKGDKVNVKATPFKGYNITGISINTITISQDKAGKDVPYSTWQVLSDPSTVKKLTGNGYSHTVNAKTNITVNTSAYRWAEINYQYDSTPLSGTGDRYDINPDKKLLIKPYYGISPSYISQENDPSAVSYGDVFCNLIVDKKDVTKEAFSKKVLEITTYDKTDSNGNTHEYECLGFNSDDPLVRGKEAVLKLNVKDFVNQKQELVTFKTYTFNVENPDNRSVTLEKDSDSMPIGTRSRSYAVDVTGDFVPVITSPGNGINASLSNDCKKLTISTSKDADEGTYKIDFLDQVRNKTLATFTLTLEATSVARTVPTAIVSGTTNNKISMVLSTGDLDRNLDGLYYVITAKTDSKTTPLEKTVTIKVSATVTSADIWLTKNTASTDGEPTDYNISVQLVQYNDNNDAVASSRTVTTEARTMDGNIFAESITLTGNGSKVHTLTGSGNPYRLTVGYSKGTSIQRLEKVELITPDGPDKKLYSETVGSGKSGKWLTVDDSSIRFYPQPNGLPADTYIIKAYAVEPQGKTVTASVSVKVNQAIESLEIIGAPDKVIKLPGKETSFTLTAIDDTDWDHRAPTKNVTWSIDGSSEIKVKNGKVTIPKTYRVKENDSFYVRATANDYKGNPTYSEVLITVTSSFSNNICLKYYDKNCEWALLSSNEILASDVFHTYYRNYSDVARVTLVEKDGQKDGVFSKYSVTGATLLGVVEDEDAYYANGSYYPVAYIAFTKPGTVKITATATDGSERKLVKTLKVKYLRGGALGFDLYDNGYDELGNNYDYDKDNVSSAKTFNFTNRGTENMPIMLNVAGYKDSLENRSLIDHSVSVKGGKLTSYKNRHGFYTIYPNSDTTVITIRNNSNRDNTLTITVDNPAIADKKGKLKITAYNKANGKDAKGTIYNSINFKDAGNYSSVCPNKVTYTLANADDAAYALITVLKDDPDWTISDTIERYDDDNLRFGNCYVYNLSGSGKDKTFTVDYASSEGIFNIAEGTYSFSVTPAIRSGNMFIATDKAATVSVKAVKTPVAKVVPVKNVYFISTSGTINNGNTAAIKAGKYTNYTAAYGVKFTGTLSVADKKGKWNNFSSNFKVATDGTLTYKGSTALNTKAKASKPELNGKVSYSYQLLNGKVVTGYAPVVIKTQKPKANKKK